MTVDDVKDYCLALPGATVHENPDPSNVLVYQIGRRNFAYFKTSEPERWRFSLRVTPDRFLELTDQPGIKPARYMGRFHWITIVDVAQLPAAILQGLIDASYQRALQGLPKKTQQDLAGNGS